MLHWSSSDGAVIEYEPETGALSATGIQKATAFDKWDGEKWLTDSDAQQQQQQQQQILLDAAASEKSVGVSEDNGITQA